MTVVIKDDAGHDEGVLAQAVEISGVKASNWDTFEAVSRKGVTYSGFICRVQSSNMGALAISQINGQKTYQYERGMPKIGYPYVGDERTVKIPLDAGLVNVRWYEKIDGTNIVAFPLRDPQDPSNILDIGYKTRLKPALTASKWGDFGALLDQVANYDNIAKAVAKAGYNLAFELWGAANSHQITQTRTLALTLHTGIRQKSLVPVRELDELASEFGLERPELLVELTESDLVHDKLEATYMKLRAEAEARNLASGKESYVTEGAIMCLSTNEHSVYIKCKPESIEEDHWMAARRLTKAMVVQAVHKLEEDSYDFDKGVQGLIDLLAQEFDPALVALATPLLEEQIRAHQAMLSMRAEVASVLDAANPDPTDKRACMRLLGAHFTEKRKMAAAFQGYERWKALKGAV